MKGERGQKGQDQERSCEPGNGETTGNDSVRLGALANAE